MNLSHFTLTIGDLDEAQRFYVDQLGLPLRRRLDAETFGAKMPHRIGEIDNANSPFHISVSIGAGAELDLFLQRGLGRQTLKPHPHVAFDVTPEMLRTKMADLERAGVPVDGPRRLGPPGQASVYFSDPWGNLLELSCTTWQGEVPVGPPDLAALARRD